MANPSHTEVWDDSVLVNSWNDALEEYKRYHSIQARGENVEKVLKAQENQGRKSVSATVKLSKQMLTYPSGEEMDYEEGELAEEAEQPSREIHAKKNIPEETVDHDTSSHGAGPAVPDKPSSLHQTSTIGPERGPPALPRHLVGQVHDEGLKNLLMSWYYAGYYTGLYEGQQQGTVEKHAKHDN
ncbi:hypothetical protein G7Y89_g9375 [Cudoniella acicularis]|uniref:Survival motor neuron Tudor domain-containing protein n=1 Tax=Cudoniella acicularis TaxID=354080 RepID=A0A8H4W063_9HELO|nr:hypothetical protein G7Y89_g9375 [Cudoniella acicularis]